MEKYAGGGRGQILFSLLTTELQLLPVGALRMMHCCPKVQHGVTR